MQVLVEPQCAIQYMRGTGNLIIAKNRNKKNGATIIFVFFGAPIVSNLSLDEQKVYFCLSMLLVELQGVTCFIVVILFVNSILYFFYIFLTKSPERRSLF